MGEFATTHLTRLEQAWNEVPASHSVVLKRTDLYDRDTGLYHSPGEYVYEKLASHQFPLDDGHISERLLALIHPGLSGDDMPTRVPNVQPPRRRRTISDELIRQMLRKAETRLVFGGTLDDILAAYRDDRVEQIRAILSHPLLGNRKNRENLAHDDIAQIVFSCLQNRLPLQLVLPAFPFKDQNPFRNPSNTSHWDIGEASLLIRLHCLALGLNQLHSYDGEWLIVSDGRAYASIFGVQEVEAAEYVAGLRGLRNALNLQRTIHIVDMRSIIERVDRCFVAVLDDGAAVLGLRAIVAHIEDRLETLRRSTEAVAGALSALAGSMVWNINTARYLKRGNARDLWRAMNPRCKRLEPGVMELRHEIELAGLRAAVKYASLALTLSASDFWGRLFPHSIRATVHAKRGQAVIPKLGRGDPWNAVGVLESASLEPDSVRTLPLWKVSKSEYLPLYLTDSADPVAFVPKKIAESFTG